jgi:hypothetical protein
MSPCNKMQFILTNRSGLSTAAACSYEFLWNLKTSHRPDPLFWCFYSLMHKLARQEHSGRNVEPTQKKFIPIKKYYREHTWACVSLFIFSCCVIYASVHPSRKKHLIKKKGSFSLVSCLKTRLQLTCYSAIVDSKIEETSLNHLFVPLSLVI